MSKEDSNSIHTFPCVVQVGFAGPRRLFDPPASDVQVEQQWQEDVLAHVKSSLEDLSEVLNLSSRHFLCGISQIACGADFVFTRAFQSLKSSQQIFQRIFIPEQVEAYLNATSSSGTPDFTPSQQVEARELLASDHIIQQRVVSLSPNRTTRFQETSAEILRFSDVVVCLSRDNSSTRPGGTSEFFCRAKDMGIPVLEIRVSVKSGRLACQDVWHNMLEPYHPPAIPEPLAQLSLPNTVGMYPISKEDWEEFKKPFSDQAEKQQSTFSSAAVGIITAHILATILATVALAGKSLGAIFLSSLLAAEIGFLLFGYFRHKRLHHSEAARIWAHSRLAAELLRSILKVFPRHVYLEHLFHLSLPARFRPFLRTLNVLYLNSTYSERHTPWAVHCREYLDERIQHQIDYYSEKIEKDECVHQRCQYTFTGCTIGAIVATGVKLGFAVIELSHGVEIPVLPKLLGIFAVVLPVLAVAGLSWAAALDCEARVETFRETHDFLEEQQTVLPLANTASEYDRLLLETESVLLGEVTNWFSRRATTGVT